MNISVVFTVVVYNTSTCSTVYTTDVSALVVLIESTIIFTSSTAMCCSYITTINKSLVSTSVLDTIDIPGVVPSEGAVVVISIILLIMIFLLFTETFTKTVVLSQFVNIP